MSEGPAPIVTPSPAPCPEPDRPSLPSRPIGTHAAVAPDSPPVRAQISGWYTRLMRDEVLAEWLEDEDGPALHVYCHVSGGLVLDRVFDAGGEFSIPGKETVARVFIDGVVPEDGRVIRHERPVCLLQIKGGCLSFCPADKEVFQAVLIYVCNGNSRPLVGPGKGG